jgi:hypothetical protein
MITNIEELLAESFNLRHLIQHTSSDAFYDPKASKKKYWLTLFAARDGK